MKNRTVSNSYLNVFSALLISLIFPIKAQEKADTLFGNEENSHSQNMVFWKDYKGGDKFPICPCTLSVSDPTLCQDSCLADPDCVCWSYVRQGSAKAGKYALCFKKVIKPEMESGKPHVVTGCRE